MIRRMIKEEWRMHSSIYHGNYFALFPVTVFLLALGFSHITLTYSELGVGALSTGMSALGAFLGLAVASIGFSSRDAMKNVLGPVNLLVYSSRTLPVSGRRLLFDFIVKDIIYYTALFMLPVSLGFLIAGGTPLLAGAVKMFSWFLLFLGSGALLARTSLLIPSGGFLDYPRIRRLGALTSKSILDLARSSGGALKVFFSLGVLTGFYWFMVLYFPVAEAMLSYPLLSFSVMTGVLNLSVYNWINRFDSPEKYLYLPVDADALLEAKKKAYLVIALPLALGLVTVSYLFYPANLLVSLLTAAATTLYTLAIATELTGLDPNTKMFDSRVFTKYLVLNSLVVVPLLVASIYYGQLQELYLVFLGLAFLAGITGVARSRNNR